MTGTSSGSWRAARCGASLKPETETSKPRVSRPESILIRSTTPLTPTKEQRALTEAARAKQRKLGMFWRIWSC
jgi:hypothetical protein